MKAKLGVAARVLLWPLRLLGRALAPLFRHWGWPAGAIALMAGCLAVLFFAAPDGRITFTDLPSVDVELSLDEPNAEVAFALSEPARRPPGVGVEPQPPGAPPIEVDPSLYESVAGLALPIRRDGRSVFSHFARPVATKPLAEERSAAVGLVIGGLGLKRAISESAAELPSDIGLAISVYAEDPAAWQAFARWRGHESLLEAPLASDDPRVDPGPRAAPIALDDLGAGLAAILSSGKGYGVLALDVRAAPRDFFERPTSSALLAALDARGVEAIALAGPPPPPGPARNAAADPAPPILRARQVDALLDAGAIDLALAALEAEALRRGYALGWARPSRLAFDRIWRWSQSLSGRGLTLAPPSQLVKMHQEFER